MHDAVRVRYGSGMAREYVKTSVGLSPELHAQLTEIKRKTAVIEFTLIGRMPANAGKGIEDVLATGAEAELARIAGVWTPEHERLLKTLPPPATLRGPHPPHVSGAEVAALLAEARELGFGPDTARDAKWAEAARLRDLGVPAVEVGKLFGVTGGRVAQWRARSEAAGARDEPARSRMRCGGLLRA